MSTTRTSIDVTATPQALTLIGGLYGTRVGNKAGATIYYKLGDNASGFAGTDAQLFDLADGQLASGEGVTLTRGSVVLVCATGFTATARMDAGVPTVPFDDPPVNRNRPSSAPRTMIVAGPGTDTAKLTSYTANAIGPTCRIHRDYRVKLPPGATATTSTFRLFAANVAYWQGSQFTLRACYIDGNGKWQVRGSQTYAVPSSAPYADLACTIPWQDGDYIGSGYTVTTPGYGQNVQGLVPALSGGMDYYNGSTDPTGRDASTSDYHDATYCGACELRIDTDRLRWVSPAVSAGLGSAASVVQDIPAYTTATDGNAPAAWEISHIFIRDIVVGTGNKLTITLGRSIGASPGAVVIDFTGGNHSISFGGVTVSSWVSAAPATDHLDLWLQLDPANSAIDVMWQNKTTGQAGGSDTTDDKTTSNLAEANAAAYEARSTLAANATINQLTFTQTTGSGSAIGIVEVGRWPIVGGVSSFCQGNVANLLDPTLPAGGVSPFTAPRMFWNTSGNGMYFNHANSTVSYSWRKKFGITHRTDVAGISASNDTTDPTPGRHSIRAARDCILLREGEPNDKAIVTTRGYTMADWLLRYEYDQDIAKIALSHNCLYLVCEDIPRWEWTGAPGTPANSGFTDSLPGTNTLARRKSNALLAGLEASGAIVIRTAAAFGQGNSLIATDVDCIPTGLSSDGIHPNTAAGYGLFAQLIAQAVNP